MSIRVISSARFAGLIGQFLKPGETCIDPSSALSGSETIVSVTEKLYIVSLGFAL